MNRAVCAVWVLLTACNGPNDTDLPTPTCADVPDMLQGRCAQCHGGDAPSADLDMQTADWDLRVSGRRGSTCAGVLADPSRPSESLLYTQLFDDPSCGSRMPLGGDPLTDDERKCVRDWIAGLAPPLADTDDDCPDCECEPDQEEACYNGPDGTLDQGICKGGERLCDPEGYWGSCEGQVLPRAEDCGTADIDENCDGLTPACTDQWLGVFGADESQVFRSVAVDSDGNVIVLGDFAGAVYFGDKVLTATGAKQDYVLLKLDPHGTVLWAQRFGDTSNQWATQVTVAPNNDIVLAGRAFGTIDFGGGVLDAEGTDDVVIARFDPSGKHLWSRMVGGNDPDRTESVVVLSGGDVVVAGAFTGTASFGTTTLISRGFRDAFVLRLHGESGDTEWVTQLGGTADDVGFAVSEGADDAVVVGGRFGDVAAMGPSIDITSGGGQDAFVASLDAAGAVVWAKGFGGAGSDRLDAVVVDVASGNMYLTGYTDAVIDFGGGALTSLGARDIWLASLDSSGAHRWSSVHGDTEDQISEQYAQSSWLNLALHPSGGVVLGGMMLGSASFGGPVLSARGKSDFLVAHLAADGSYVGGQIWGSSGTELLHDVAVAPDGDVVFAGRFWSGPVDFGSVGVARDVGTNAEGLVVKLTLQ